MLNRPPHIPIYRTSAGVTLVEMIVVIVISGIIAGILATIIRSPMMGIDAQVRRTELVDMAESALRRMQRDIRSALPNSVRIRSTAGNTGDASCPANANVCVLELLHSLDGGRYRAQPPGNANARLQFGVVDTDFDVIGVLQTLNPADLNLTTYSLVINNQASTGTQFNAYFGDNRTLLAAGTNTTHITMVGKNFPATLASSRQRFFIVDTPVTYLCNTTTQTLTRYQGYTITADHTTIDTDAELTGKGATPARAADLVVGCRFTYLPGTSARAGLVTLEMTIQGSAANEQVRLLHQVHVYNVP